MGCTMRNIVEIPLAILSKILAQSRVTSLPELCRPKGGVVLGIA